MANYRNHPKTPVAQRFWQKVAVGCDDECWLWTASRHRQGYGQLGDSNGKLVRSHRVAYELTHGAIPSGMSVLHHCDNPPCCNPKHLFLGTQTDNMRDAKRKGRMRFPKSCPGEENPASKLSEDKVKEILILGGRRSQQTIAERFGVTQTLIGKILRREIWRHVA